jgi:hypothetical protein
MNEFPVSVTCHSRTFPVSIPASIVPNRFPVSHNLFLQSIHWVQSHPRLAFRFLASTSIFFSCSTVYETPIYVSFFVPFPCPSSLQSSWHLFFLPLVVSLSHFSLLSAPVFFISSFPCRAHNCITERLFSQLTFFPLRPHSSRYVHIYRSRNRIVLFVHTHNETKR